MLIEFALQKRVLIVLFALGLLMAGLQAYLNLPLEAYPDIANMQVRVITQVPGKAAEEMERLVTIPLEKELNGIPRALPPRSVTIFALSVVTIVFQDGVDPYVARQQVLEKISQASLPDGVQPQLDPNASPVGEIYRYTVESKKWNSMDRKEWQDWVLDRKFKSVSGVVDVTGFGGPTKIYQVLLDPDRMKALAITQAQVSTAISSSNGSTGGSYIIHNDQDFMVRGLGLLHNVDDIKNIVVASNADGVPILLKDFSDVSVTSAVRKGQVGKIDEAGNDDDDVVEGIVLMRRGENPSTAVAVLMQQWNDISGTLPPGMHLKKLYDRTELVRHTMNTIGHNVAEGIFLVVVMLILFLFQVRSAIICATVIPLALSVAFILLNVFGVPGNLLSLGAIDFGIIVDGAIVMVENIVRHLAHVGEKPSPLIVVKTIGKAAREVAKPVLFATSIIITTFLPILTFESVEGKLFRPLAITMNFNLIGAVLCSLTIIPVLCAVVFRAKPPKEVISPVMKVAVAVYKPLLTFAMNRKLIVFTAALAIIVGSLSLAPMLGAEFIPELEEGNIWLRVTVLPTSVSLDRSVVLAREIRQTLHKYPIVTNIITQVGTPDDGTDPNNYSNIEVFVDLKPQEEWPKNISKQQMITAMDKELRTKLPGLQYNFSQYIKDNMDEAISGVKGELAIKVFGKDLDTLSTIGNQITHIVENVPGMADVACDHLLGQPQIVVTIDRQRASRYGVNAQDILSVVETSIGGKAITTVFEGERRFDLVLRYNAKYRADSAELADIQVPTPSGSRIPLIQVASIGEDHGATAILRDENSRRVAIKANIRGRDLCSAVDEARKLVDQKVKMPEGYRIVWGGQFERAQHAMSRLMLIVPLTLILIFFLLYVATGAARIALLVMTAIPLALPGAIIGLLLTHTHFSISAGVGLIALAGVSVQNGVILVSLVSALQKSGLSLREAVMKSAMVRMQPAVMTTCVAMAGLIPAALSTGIGSQSQKPFAIIIVCGLIPAIFLALMILPPLYEWIERNFGEKHFYDDDLHTGESMNESQTVDI